MLNKDNLFLIIDNKNIQTIPLKKLNCKQSKENIIFPPQNKSLSCGTLKGYFNEFKLNLQDLDKYDKHFLILAVVKQKRKNNKKRINKRYYINLKGGTKWIIKMNFIKLINMS